MASSDWLKLAALCFARKVYLKIDAFVTVLGQDSKVIDRTCRNTSYHLSCAFCKSVATSFGGAFGVEILTSPCWLTVKGLFEP